MLIGVGLLVVSLIITLSVAIGRRTVETLPADWTIIHDRWQAYHAARTLASLAGFGCALAAVVWSARGPQDRCLIFV